MTLDEYMAGTDKAWIGYSGDHRNLLDEAVGRLRDMTADRDSWIEQCMDARREWEAAIAERNSWKFQAETATEGMRNVEVAPGVWRSCQYGG